MMASAAAARCCKWVCLRHDKALIKRHVLVLTQYNDLKYLDFEHYKFFEYVLFEYCTDTVAIDLQQCTQNYYVQVFKANDDMRDIRYNVKRVYKTPVLGHICVLSHKPPMYAFLKEWFVMPHFQVARLHGESLVWGFPHVLVFDLDSTLITEEQQVRIRDEFVYDSLQELRDAGCVLVLWSYGSRDHVAHSLRDLQLDKYFDVVISEGATVDECDSTAPKRKGHVTSDDGELQKRYVEHTFLYDMNVRPNNTKIPKSPKIVIKYLRDKKVNFFKSITLIDDLPSNDYAYDFYVKVKRCPVGVRDWHVYHDQILDNISEFERDFTVW